MIKILEVNNIDLPGKGFNGYDLISLSNQNFSIKQSVIIKQSDNKRVNKILNCEKEIQLFNDYCNLEEKISVSNIFSIVSPSLMDSKEYKEADIVHFHMFHNSKLSLFSLIEISRAKKVVISLHDPWFITGRCVHFYNCQRWKDGCKSCQDLNTLFKFDCDNCSEMWKLKKNVFDNIDIDIVVTSNWMLNLVKASPIFAKQKKIHLIPFGIDVNKYNSVSQLKAKKHFGISNEEKTIFLRSQKEFKGTEYVLDALKQLSLKSRINIITCDQKNLLKDVVDKYNIIDLGYVLEKEIIYAMSACDIFLMPSKGESFGVMAIEAMASSKPVIIFDNTALPTITFAPECGFLVKDRDSKDLAKAIEYLINSPSECKRRGKLGYIKCKENYDINEYNKKTLSLYSEVYSRIHICKKISYQKDKKCKNIVKLISDFDNDTIDCNYNIDYSSLYIQKIIDKNNKLLYKKIKKLENNVKKVNIKRKIKNWIKMNSKLYIIIKKIVRKKDGENIENE